MELNKILLILLLSFVIANSANTTEPQPVCTICSKCTKCGNDIMSDLYIDKIHRVISKAISNLDLPL